MAQAQLNFVESELDHSSDLYVLYDRLYQGMVAANEVDAPLYPSADDCIVRDPSGTIVFESDGNPKINTAKVAEIKKLASDYSTILIKNSAYMFANSIISAMSGGGGGEGGAANTGFVSRAGDSMKGMLRARYGFEAGVQNIKIFDVYVDGDNVNTARVYGALKVDSDISVGGNVDIKTGISLDGHNVFYWDNGTVTIENPDIKLKGTVAVDGTITLGNLIIGSTGITLDGGVFYHAGNSNKADVDWTMRDANVEGDLTVKGEAELKGVLRALYGFELGELGVRMLYTNKQTVTDENGDSQDIAWIDLNTDLHIVNGYGIKFNDDYIIRLRNSNIVSFSAPGRIMCLGDSDNGVATQKISLQAGVYDSSGNYQLITKEGAGYFPNGLMAKCAIAGSTVLKTFSTDSDNYGVLFSNQIRFTDTDGPAIFSEPMRRRLYLQLPYLNSEVSGFPTEQLNFETYYATTTSPFRNLDAEWSATLHFNTDADFLCYDKPVEAAYFAIKSERYHTRLMQDALFFDDGKFIEGVTDGLRHAGNGYFDGNISSPTFASGFAGYGWAIKRNPPVNDFHATFDSLTVRKKMRVYELEVQKISCTNGSLWVSDSCSGDEVIALN